jgi:hypothetical protein
MAGVIKGAS